MTSEAMTTHAVGGSFKQVAGLSIGIAILMVALGVLAIAIPQATGIGVVFLVSCITIFSGLAHLAYAFAAECAGTFLWRLLIGIVYVVGGIYLAFNPGLSLVSSLWCWLPSSSLKACCGLCSSSRCAPCRGPDGFSSM